MSTLQTRNIKHDAATATAIALSADGGVAFPGAVSGTAPASPADGQMWIDTSGASPVAKFYDATGAAWQSFSSAGPATFDEGASSGATFYTLTDPDGDGIDYRYAEFLSSGTLVFATEGFFDTWLGGPGGRGGYTGTGGYLGGGGGCGGVLELHDLYGGSGSYTVTVGTQTGTSIGTPTSISGPLPAPLTTISAAPGNAGGGANSTSQPTTAGATGSLATTYTSYASGTGSGGYGGGSGGTGGAGSGRAGGAAATYTGWAQTSFSFGAGGWSDYSAASGAANSGNGGYGSQNTSYGNGGSGRAYVRVKA